GAGPNVLKLIALKHRVTASIRTSVNLTDIVLTVRRKPRDDNPEIMAKINLNKFVTVAEGSTTVFEYPIEIWLPSFITVTFEPTSSQLLFKPSAFEVKIDNECLKDVVTFKGRTGLFVSGEIKPKLDGVTITVKDKKNGKVVLLTKSDMSGKYIGGPFDYDDSSEIEISAEKEGYLFQKLWSEANDKLFGSFEAQKLAGITVKVINTDDKKNPQLKDVLISISGGSDNFRKNSITPESGQLSFVGLNPGQYFVRAVLKEYLFEPSSKIIDVKQGETVVFEIKGKRVAFSCYGVTNSLNGQPEGGILLEAVGTEGVSQDGTSCSHFLEETVSEANGQFRIRDLQPNCKYTIRLKKDEKNEQISRSIPSEHIVTIPASKEAKDITGIRLILFRKSTQMDISGIVHTKPEYWSSLKVKLHSENNPELPISVITLTSAFFALPSISIDGRGYYIKLESTLSTSLYEFQTPIAYFQANRSFEHFDFTFTPKQRSSSAFSDHDVMQGVLDFVNLVNTLYLNFIKKF
ncbi:nodal modulator 3-like protein, partial [Leptotrombidium deliense]